MLLGNTFLFAQRTRSIVLLALFGLSVLVLASCGGSDDESAQATPSERAFLQGMVPHHESAVDMARVAGQRAQHPELRRLADAIVSTQTAEIAEMETIHERLFGEALRPDENAHDELGLSAEDAGMMHGDAQAMMLMEQTPFDRAFIDEMVPHHQGAVRMAQAVLDDSEDAAIRGLAEKIVSAQNKEIAQMNGWRNTWYGSGSPANEMEHGGH